MNCPDNSNSRLPSKSTVRTIPINRPHSKSIVLTIIINRPPSKSIVRAIPINRQYPKSIELQLIGNLWNQLSKQCQLLDSLQNQLPVPFKLIVHAEYFVWKFFLMFHIWTNEPGGIKTSWVPTYKTYIKFIYPALFCLCLGHQTYY